MLLSFWTFFYCYRDSGLFKCMRFDFNYLMSMFDCIQLLNNRVNYVEKRYTN